MKEIQVTESRQVTKYVAVDGTVFPCKEECEKYEQSAEGVLKSKYMKLVQSTHNAMELIQGSDDNDIHVIKLSEASDVDTVLQYFFLKQPYYLKDDEPSTKWRKVFETMARKAYESGSLLLMGENYDGDPYFIDTLDDFINRLTELKTQKKEEPNNEK